MAPRGAGDLQDVIRIDRRRTTTADPVDGVDYGNTVGDWVPFIARRAAQLLPLPVTPARAEMVIGARAQGRAYWTAWIRYDREAALTDTDCRVVDARDARRTWNVISCEDMDGRRTWLCLTLERGGADG